MIETAAFWDSSSLIPLCIQEAGTPEARKLQRQFAIVVWWGTTVEVHSAVSRLARSGTLTLPERKVSFDRIERLARSWREIVPTNQLREIAETQLQKYPLRGADSLQLAAALIWCQQKPKRRRFLSGDTRLCEAAEAAGFSVTRTS